MKIKNFYLNHRIIFSILLFIFFYNTFLFSKSEIGVQINNFYNQENRYFSALKYSFYNYYQIQKLNIFSSSIDSHSNQYEIYYKFYTIFNLNDSIKITIGKSQIPNIKSKYLSANNQILSLWKGQFDFFLFGYSYQFPFYFFYKRNFLEIFGDFGFIYHLELELKKYEFSQHFLSEPFSYSRGKFFTKEGYLTRIGLNLNNQYKFLNFRVGIFFQYALTSYLDGKFERENKKLILYNQNKLWISNDITNYLKNKENYESQYLNSLYNFPKIENYKFIQGSVHLFFCAGISF